jgi:protein-L-isoaspartate(D-aspartate) O-methyltransferase
MSAQKPPVRTPKFPLRLDAFSTPASMQRTVLRPHAPLAHAAPGTGASRVATASGLGLDSADVRLGMLQRLRKAGTTNEAVLHAMGRVPRHLFVDPGLVAQAYEDTSLPIGHGQTISKPSVVARMLELLMGGVNARRKNQRLGQVLEIGTGCGYQAAVLARLGEQVFSVERLKPLHDKARDLLSLAGRPANLRLVYGAGSLGHPPNAPYDSLIAAAGGDALPPAWLEQLAVGGRLVSPVRQSGSEQQVLMVVDRTEQGYTHSVHETVHFVPLQLGVVS